MARNSPVKRFFRPLKGFAIRDGVKRGKNLVIPIGSAVHNSSLVIRYDAKKKKLVVKLVEKKSSRSKRRSAIAKVWV